MDELKDNLVPSSSLVLATVNGTRGGTAVEFQGHRLSSIPPVEKSDLKEDPSRTVDASTPEPEIGPDGDPVFYVEKILKKRLTKEGNIFYFVKWKNYKSKYNTWEPVSSFHSESVLKDYEKGLRIRGRRGKRRKRRRFLPRKEVSDSDSDPDYEFHLPRYLDHQFSKEIPRLAPIKLETTEKSSTVPGGNSCPNLSVVACENLTFSSVVKTEWSASPNPLGSTEAVDLPEFPSDVDVQVNPKADPKSLQSPVELSAADLAMVKQRKLKYINKCAKKSPGGKSSRMVKDVGSIDGGAMAGKSCAENVSDPGNTVDDVGQAASVKRADGPTIPVKKISKIEMLLMTRRTINGEKKRSSTSFAPKVAKVLPVKRKVPSPVNPELQIRAPSVDISGLPDTSDEESPEEYANAIEFTVITDGHCSFVFEESRSPYGFLKNFSREQPVLKA